jgi:aminopeptidase N
VGAAGEDDIAALAAEDASDISRRGALRAGAAAPTAAAREAAWSRATGPGLSLAERQAVLDGWAAPGRPDLLAPFEERFFAALAPVEAASGVESALALARTAFPRWPLDAAATVARAERWAGGDELAAPVRRALVEQAALLARRRRALAAAPPI